jgi:hypothetical protein
MDFVDGVMFALLAAADIALLALLRCRRARRLRQQRMMECLELAVRRENGTMPMPRRRSLLPAS